MEFNLFQQKEKPQIEKVLVAYLEEQSNSNGTLHQAMHYSLTAGGKRIRPLLLLATIQALGGEVSQGYEAAAALEFIHTYSLIHDDLPAMDDDDLRRGKPTNHKVYGEDIAILAGDGLLTQAFEILAGSLLPPSKKVALILALAQAAGPNGMVAGQVEDMEGENQALSLAALKAVHEKKTGELLKFAVYAGGLIAEVSADVERLLLDFATHFGLAFQILDDILDVIGDTKTLGKQTGKDAVLSKSTYPALLTLEGAKEALRNEITKAKENLRQIEIAYKQADKELDSQLLFDLLDLLSVQ